MQGDDHWVLRGGRCDRETSRGHKEEKDLGVDLREQAPWVGRCLREAPARVRMPTEVVMAMAGLPREAGRGGWRWETFPPFFNPQKPVPNCFGLRRAYSLRDGEKRN